MMAGTIRPGQNTALRKGMALSGLTKKHVDLRADLCASHVQVSNV
jgi:hypothetical protein